MSLDVSGSFLYNARPLWTNSVYFDLQTHFVVKIEHFEWKIMK